MTLKADTILAVDEEIILYINILLNTNQQSLPTSIQHNLLHAKTGGNSSADYIRNAIKMAQNEGLL
jgi:hypothetical protein